MNSIYEVRILIVDDNKDLLHLLCEQLSGAGYRHIQTAANCAAAKKLFAAEIPELMILDINLPDGDGFSLFRALHAKADVPALFLSARDADADRLFGLGLGADDYLKSQALNAKNITGFCVLSFSQFPFCFFVHIQQPSNFAISSLKRSSAVP